MYDSFIPLFTFKNKTMKKFILLKSAAIKRKIATVFLCCFFTTILCSSFAQSGNEIVARNPAAILRTTGGTTTNNSEVDRAKKLTYVNSKVQKSFDQWFANASEVDWYSVDKKNRVYLVLFNSNGNTSHARFQKNGNLLYAITHCTEKDLPIENRKSLKSKYVDYAITSVIKVMADGKVAWIANLQNSENIIIVKAIDGVLEEMKTYKNATVKNQ